MYSGNQGNASPHPKTPPLQEEGSRQPCSAAHGVLLARVGDVSPRLMGQVKLQCCSSVASHVTHCHCVWPFPHTLPMLMAKARRGPARTCHLAGMHIPAGMDACSHSGTGFREGEWFSFYFARLVFLPVGSTQAGAGAVGPELHGISWRRQLEPSWRA